MRTRQKEVQWSSRLAYAVGLITTDGNLSPDGRHFTFVSNDLDQVETFKKCLRLNRGSLDGDGDIRRYRDPVYKNSVRLYLRFASLLHIEWLQNKIEQLASRPGFIQKGIGVYTLTFSKHDSINLLNRMYSAPDIPYLARKYSIAKEFLSVPA